MTACDWKWQGIVFQVSWALSFLGSLLRKFGLIPNLTLLRRVTNMPALVLILPFTVIHDLDLTKRARMGLYFVSLVGVLDIAISLIRFLNVELGDGGEFRSFTTIGKSPLG
jgi:hypothetical protein